ncbi:MAG: ABC transporter permease [Verrucomicrobiota bacterium]
MKSLFAQYGVLLVLLGLCLLFSSLTIQSESATGESAAEALVERVWGEVEPTDDIIVAGAARKESGDFAEQVGELFEEKGKSVIVVIGSPRDLKLEFDKIRAAGSQLGALVVSDDTAKWGPADDFAAANPGKVYSATARTWPDFLTPGNLIAVVDRIVVIAVIAIGMTLVILTGGIDLSVGSLIALSAVVATTLMKWLGGLEASAAVVVLGFLLATLLCGGVGALSGGLVAWFRVAPFIVTLAVMMVARGAAFKFTGGFSIYQVPEALTWLGHGRTLGIPNTVILLVLLYSIAWIFMERTKWGRYIYAVGGNEEAARLSGVPVRFILILVYTVSGLAAGFGGCIQASQIASGAPNLGLMFELQVIAAVVVGGTSLSGGSGRILGTLIGAFIIAVIQNGMNLVGFDSYTQQIVLGAVILGAVLVDQCRRDQWDAFRRLRKKS